MLAFDTQVAHFWFALDRLSWFDRLLLWALLFSGISSLLIFWSTVRTAVRCQLGPNQPNTKVTNGFSRIYRETGQTYNVMEMTDGNTMPAFYPTATTPAGSSPTPR